MFAIYKTAAAGVTINDILNDFGLLLTGTTDKTLLSAACDQANTSIYAGYDAAGWTEYDRIGGATPTTLIFSAPTLEGGQTKYFDISVSSTNLRPRLWESWNAGTDTGTNGSNSSQSGLPLAATISTFYYVYAHARTVVILKGNSTDLLGCMEFDRTYWPSQSVANGFLPALTMSFTASYSAWSSAQAPMYGTRYYGRDGILGGASVAPAGYLQMSYQPIGILNNYLNSVALTYLWRNETNQETAPIFKLGMAGIANTSAGIDAGELSTINKIVGTKGGAALDEFSYDGMTYICIPPPTNMTYGCFAVPKG